jgi:hypothetical protein
VNNRLAAEVQGGRHDSERDRLLFAAALLRPDSRYQGAAAAAIQAAGCSGAIMGPQGVQPLPLQFYSLYCPFNQDQPLWNAALHMAGVVQGEHQARLGHGQASFRQLTVSQQLQQIAATCHESLSRRQSQQQQQQQQAGAHGQDLAGLLAASGVDELPLLQGGEGGVYLGGDALPVHPSTGTAGGAASGGIGWEQLQVAAVASRAPLGDLQGPVGDAVAVQTAHVLQQASAAGNTRLADKRAAVVDSEVVSDILEGLRRGEQRSQAADSVRQLTRVIQRHADRSQQPVPTAAAEVVLHIISVIEGRLASAQHTSQRGTTLPALWLAAELQHLGPIIAAMVMEVKHWPQPQVERLPGMQQQEEFAAGYICSLRSLTCSSRQQCAGEEVLVGFNCGKQLGMGASGKVIQVTVVNAQPIGKAAAAGSSSSSSSQGLDLQVLKPGSSMAAKIVRCHEPANLPAVLRAVAQEAEVHRLMQECCNDCLRCYGWGSITTQRETHGLLLLELAAADLTALFRFSRQLQPAPLTYTFMCLDAAAVQRIVRKIGAQLCKMHEVHVFHGERELG